MDDTTYAESAEELYEDAPCGYLSTSPDGTITRANRTFLAWSGYAADELVGRRRFYDLLPPGAKIYYETHYAPLLQMQGSVRELALELVRSDGSRLPILVNAATKQDDAGRPLLVRITVFDASDRRRYERELLQARSEAEARAAAAMALEHVTEGVVLLDEDGRVQLLNPAAERIFGVAASDVRGLALTAIAPDWPEVATRISIARSGESPRSSVVVPLELGGAVRWLAASGEAAPAGVVYTFRDVTDEHHLDELRDDIVAVVSHELRTPLTGVYGAAETLASLGEKLSVDEHRRLLGVIREQSGRLTRIVEQVQLTQGLATGETSIERRRFDVGELVEEVVGRSAAWRASGPVETSIDPDTEAEGDPRMFEQVLVTLLDNAFRYGSGGTVRVRVRVEQAGASVRVLVADEGPGIRPADRDRIFERFVRLDPGQEDGVAGIGLGLYIARELVGRMHGRLELVPSERGATFAVELPAASAAR